MSQFYRLGDVVRVPIQWLGGIYFHFGIVTDFTWWGGPLITSCSLRRGCVAEETLAEFAQGQPVTVVGYLGHLAPETVVARARKMIGAPWNLFNFNCEHFVRWAHGLVPESPQLRNAAARQWRVQRYVGEARGSARSVPASNLLTFKVPHCQPVAGRIR